MTKRFKKSDLTLLLQIFIPGKYNLFIEDPNNVLEYTDGDPVHRSHVSSDASYSVCVRFGDSETQATDYDFIVDFTGEYKSPHISLKTFHYINNPDKTLRWVFPTGLKKPSFLSFYNSSGWKANLLSSMLRFAYRLGLGQWFHSGTFTIRQNTPLKVESWLADIPHESYSIFTGTVGPNRKLLVELNTAGVSTHFVKIAISDLSSKLIGTEVSSIKKIQALHLKSMDVPRLVKSSDLKYAVYSNINPDVDEASKELSPVHLNALTELYERTAHCQHSDMNGFKQLIVKMTSELVVDERIADSKRMIAMLRGLADKLSTDIVPFAMTHFDFTPWNMYSDGKKLYVYDWELSQRKAPVLYDIFHYAFQKGILVDRSDLNAINREINDALTYPSVKDLISRYHVNIELCYEAYLLYTISYYLQLYSAQKILHKQVYWLVAVWQKALEELCASKKEMTQRKSFIQNLVAHLEQYDYALMKFSELRLSELQESSDLDILIKKDNLNEIIRYIKGSSGIRKMRIVKKTFMCTVALFFDDGSFLSIDLLLEFKRKSKRLFQASKVLNHVGVTMEGVKVPQRHHDFEYMVLFYQLNQSYIPAKYLMHFDALTVHEKTAILDYMKFTYGLSESTRSTLFFYNEKVRRELNLTIDGREENKGWRHMLSKIRYVKDTLLESFYNRGVVITVSGVDGAGKSTIIEDLKQTFSQKFRRKVIVLRHRPSLLPILSAWRFGKKQAEAMAADRLPRQGNNKSKLSSLFRFVYYYTDYLVGQGYIYVRYVLRGYTVIYDRYYFDFIGDSKRSNIEFNKNFITWLYAFVYKPSLNVLLYAPAEVIRLRKRELEEEDIKTLTRDYLGLFNKLAAKNGREKYLTIENTDRQYTVERIVKEYIKVS